MKSGWAMLWISAVAGVALAAEGPPPPPVEPDPRVGLAPAIRWTEAPAPFTDCADVCPQMMAIPPGEITVGSPDTEAGRTPDEVLGRAVVQGLAVGRYEVTRAEFAAFVEDTGRKVETGCPTDRAKPGAWVDDPAASWRDPGFPQTDRDPVACVSWDEAEAYAAWLAARTGKPYRLLTEAEFEYAARAGATAPYGWGEAADGACLFANGRDAAFARTYQTDRTGVGCDDGFSYTAPVGSFLPNAFGLFDTAGNVWEWTSTCLGGCIRRIQRGGGWGAPPVDLRHAQRVAVLTDSRDSSTGFRVARDF